MNDGSHVSFILSEKPRVTFTADSIAIVSTASQSKAKRSEVVDIKFIKETTNSVEKGGEASCDINADRVSISNLAPGCIVNLFTAGGRKVITQKSGVDGTATINIGTLPAGIYLLDYNKTTIKFIKP